ncbi:MAG: Mov34/MPN/PAD-1 family protein [Bacteroidia bacterium]|nr:Mov34/MPN/PAD-1 family protein [Bacteroidia bacterium]
MALQIKYRKAPAETAPPDWVMPSGACQVTLTDYTPDSRVRHVWFAPACIRSIHQWVLDSRQDFLVPETGGFLLGQYQAADTQYDLAIHTFMPGQAPAYSSPNRLEFGQGDLLALDQLLQASPALRLIGWFHTHPGHTPYLSETDLILHDRFFREPYQVALVLDCLTHQFDSCLLARTHAGRMNNVTPAMPLIGWNELFAPCLTSPSDHLPLRSAS